MDKQARERVSRYLNELSEEEFAKLKMAPTTLEQHKRNQAFDDHEMNVELPKRLEERAERAKRAGVSVEEEIEQLILEFKEKFNRDLRAEWHDLEGAIRTNKEIVLANLRQQIEVRTGIEQAYEQGIGLEELYEQIKSPGEE